ncbi:MAG: hypothetical protein JXR53_00560 [Bacteroidales bacterium]|nr:hypothetical protein [Bacteroidales bacterium]
MRRIFCFLFVLTFSFCALSQTVKPDSGLILHYPLNGDALDQSGNGNHGAVSTAGVYASPNKSKLTDSAMFFNGAYEQGNINMPLNIMNGRTEFSMSFWFNLASATSGMSLVGLDNVLETGFYTSPNRITVYHPTSGSINSVTLTQTTGVWQHLAITCSASEIKIYLNGSLAHSASGNYSLGSNTVTPNIGGNVVNQSNNSWFRGSIDEVRFYDRVINQNEVNLLSSALSLTYGISSISSTNLCAGDQFDVSYLIMGAGVYANNVFTLQLSDENGSFDNPYILASQAGTGSGSFLGASIPDFIETSNLYKIRVVSNMPMFEGTESTQSLNIFNPSESKSTLENGRILWYKFDSNTADSSGNGMDGTAIGGCSYVADRNGNLFSAIQFNGTNAYVDVPDAPWFDGNPFAASCWVKPLAYNYWSRIFDFSQGENDENIVWALSNATTGKQFVSFRLGSTEVTTLNGTVLPLNQWSHVAFSFDGSNLHLYINGSEIASTSASAPRYIQRTVNYIGRSAWASDSYANAVYDDFGLWNRALTENEIKTLYSSSLIYSNSPVCNGNVIHLEAPYITVASYAWSGPSFSATGRVQDIPSVSAANQGMYYVTINNGSCSYTDSLYVNVITPGSQSAASLTGLPNFTYTDAATNTLVGNPTGGVFAGPGISGSVFDPTAAGIGTHIIVYSYMNAGGCVSTASDTVFVGYGVNMQDTIITACKGGFFDSGGRSANYSDNESSTITFCSGGSERLQFYFKAMSIGIGDTLWAYDGPNTSSELIAMYIAYSGTDYLWSSSSCLTFRFKSNGSSTTSGWEAEYQCMTDPVIANEYTNVSGGFRTFCSGVLRDPGGSGNYTVPSYRTETYKSSDGNKLKFDFSFLTVNGNNGGHWVSFYDGPTTAYPKIGSYNEWAWPPSSIVETSQEYVTVVFDANNTSAGSRSGFEATISCTSSPDSVITMHDTTISICSAVIYDHAGPAANYAANRRDTMTLCSDSGNLLKFSFNHNETGFASGDTLWIFDGNDCSGELLGMYISSTRMDNVFSLSSCVTFVFHSDASSQSRGWQGFLSCVPVPAVVNYNISTGIRGACEGIIRDPGGTSNYSVPSSARQTYKSFNGNRIRLDVNSLSINGNNGGHWLHVYDGPSSSYPRIGSYNQWAWPSGSVIESTGEYLTLYFDATNTSAGSAAGFELDLACTTPVLPIFIMKDTTISVCDAVIYDNGGPAANYSDNLDDTMTICSALGQLLSLTFNHNVSQFSSGDTLWIFDGPTTSSPQLGMYISSSRIDNIVSSDTCLTLRFKSNSSGNSRGWQGYLSCITAPSGQVSYNMSSGERNVCAGKFYDPGGTGNYPDGVYTQTFTSYSGERLRFTRVSFNVNGNNGGHPFKVYDGPSTASPLIGTYTNFAFPPTVFQSTGSSLTFNFNSTNTSAGNTAGWEFDISCFTNDPIDVTWLNSPLCQGEYFDIPFILNDTVNAGNIFTAQLSNASGSFASPVNIGLLTDTLSGTIIAQIPLATPPGTGYRVRVVSSNPAMVGSISPNPIVIVETPVAANITAVGNTTFCQGSGSVSLSAPNQNGVNYAWKKDGISIGTNNPVLSATQAGVYTLEISNSCDTVLAVNSITLMEESPLAKPLIGNNGSLSFCLGDSVILFSDSVSGVTYHWYKNGVDLGIDTHFVLVFDAGNYAVQIENVCGLSPFSDTVQVSISGAVPLAQTIIAYGSTHFCPGDSVMLSVTYNSGNSYQWFADGTPVFSDTNEVYAKNVATYTVEESNLCGNSLSSNSIGITHKDEIQAVSITASGPLSFCNGSSVILSTDYISGQHYQWYKNGNLLSGDTSSILVSDSGFYTVSTWNECGLLASTDTLEVIILGDIPATPVISASGPVSFCSGDSVVLSSSIPSGNVWSNGETTQNITVLNSNFYYVFADGGNGCVSDTSNIIVVESYPVPTAAVNSSSPTLCPNDSFVVLTAGGGNTYEWFFNGLANGVSTQTLHADSIGTYMVIAENTYSCTDTASFILTQGILPVATLSYAANHFCQGSSMTIDVMGSGISSYIWYRNSLLLSGYTSSSHAVFSDGLYFVEVENTDGCSAVTDSVIMTMDTLPTANLSASSLSFCSGSSVVLTADVVPGANYEWIKDGITTGVSGASNSYTASIAGEYYVMVSTNCSNQSNSIFITESTVPGSAGPISGTASFCPGEELSFFIAAVSGADYYWWEITPSNAASIINGQGTNTVAIASMNTNFNISVTPRNDCGDGNASSKTVSVITNGSCDFNIMFAGTPGNVCQGNSVIFYNYTNSSYYPGSTPQWNFGSGASPATASGNGPHTVTYSTQGFKTVTLDYVDNFSGMSIGSETKYDYIFVSPPVNTSAISGNTFVQCDGSTEYYYVVETSGSIYTWSVPVGVSIISGQGTHEVLLQFNSAAGQISVEELSNSGCTGNEVVLNVSCNTVSISSNENNSLLVFPNPANEYVMVSADFIIEKIELYSMQNKLIFSSEPMTKEYKLTLKTLPAASYQLRIISENEVKTLLLIKE